MAYADTKAAILTHALAAGVALTVPITDVAIDAESSTTGAAPGPSSTPWGAPGPTSAPWGMAKGPTSRSPARPASSVRS